MIIKRERTISKPVKTYEKWIAWMMVVGLASYGLISHRALFGRMFGCGASSGKLAKLEFCLRESIQFSVNSVAWSPDRRYIATGSMYSREIHIWNVRWRRIIKRLPIPNPPPFFHQLAWSPDGRFLAACDGTGVLRIYNTETWRPAHVFTELYKQGFCEHPAFSSDSSRIAIIGARLVVYSVSDWRMLESASLQQGWAKGDQFNTVAYVPDTYAVLVGGGQYIRDLRDDEKEPWMAACGRFARKALLPVEASQYTGRQGGVLVGVLCPIWLLVPMASQLSSLLILVLWVRVLRQLSQYMSFGFPMARRLELHSTIYVALAAQTALPIRQITITSSLGTTKQMALSTS